MLETVSAAETAPYCFLFNGSIFFFAICAPYPAPDIVAKRKESRTRKNERGGYGLAGGRSLRTSVGITAASFSSADERVYDRSSPLGPSTRNSSQPLATRQSIPSTRLCRPLNVCS